MTETTRAEAFIDALTFRLHFGPPLNDNDLVVALLVRDVVLKDHEPPYTTINHREET